MSVYFCFLSGGIFHFNYVKVGPQKKPAFRRLFYLTIQLLIDLNFIHGGGSAGKNTDEVSTGGKP